jgi:hypothetical protein
MNLALRHLFLPLAAASLLTACGGPASSEGGDGAVSGEYGVSHTGSTRSHNVGQDCLNCHKTGGIGDGVFSVAGTVYNGSTPATGGTVYLYADKAQTVLLKTLEVDAYGNFYTIDAIAELSGPGGVAGVYAKVNNSTMPGVISNGSCNNCHTGGSVARI